MLKEIRKNAKTMTDEMFSMQYEDQKFILFSGGAEGSFTELCVGGRDR